jgi:hypothetical protein
MNHLTLALHPPVHAQHGGGQDDAPLLLEKAGPDDEVGASPAVWTSWPLMPTSLRMQLTSGPS